MSTLSLFHPPSPWSNQPVRLYHGTTVEHAFSITTTGVRVSAGRSFIDFGPGFYATTLERQARAWAWQRADETGKTPAVVYGDIDREALAGLDCLSFVRGDFHADDFWSFVVHCRHVGTDHARAGEGSRRYDVVIGPVTAFWKQRTSDQVSFHTLEAEAVLNATAWRML